MPFKSKKQKTYLAINEPEVYKKFKKEENMYKVKKRAKGGKVYKVDNSGQQMVAKQYGGKVK